MEPKPKHAPATTVLVTLAPETERALQVQAAGRGKSLQALLEEMAEREAGSSGTAGGKAPTNGDEFERWLDELSEGLNMLQSLPADFSRADVYDEHD